MDKELAKWKEYEKSLARYFDLSRNKGFQREKVLFYRQLLKRSHGSNTAEQRLVRRALRHETRALERKLFPNLLIRLIYRLVVVPIRLAIVRSKEDRITHANGRDLQKQLSAAGFSDLVPSLQKQMQVAQSDFTLTNVQQLADGQHLMHDVRFSKDDNGCFHLKTIISEMRRPDATNAAKFSWDFTVDLQKDQVANLLSGRACKCADKWVELDFNDRDAKGNFRLRQSDVPTSEEIQRQIMSLPFAAGQQVPIELLMRSLEKGNREPVLLTVHGKSKQHYLETELKSGGIRLFDDRLQKVGLNGAKQQGTGLKKYVGEKQRPVKRNNIRLN